MDYSSHTFRSLSTGWGVSHYPEEAVGGPLGSQTALHTRRELVPPANSEVIIIVTCLLSEHENMNRDIQRIQGYTHMYCVKIKYKVHFVNLSLNVANREKNGANVIKKSTFQWGEAFKCETNSWSYFSKMEMWHGSSTLSAPLQGWPPLRGAGLSHLLVRCLFIEAPQRLHDPQQLQ